jgi:hypothetical protein
MKKYICTNKLTCTIANGKKKDYKIGEEIPANHMSAATIKQYLAGGILTEVAKKNSSLADSSVEIQEA